MIAKGDLVIRKFGPIALEGRDLPPFNVTCLVIRNIYERVERDTFVRNVVKPSKVIDVMCDGTVYIGCNTLWFKKVTKSGMQD